MCSSNIPLEDDACDIIAKAMHGQGVSSKQLASFSKLKESEVDAILKGHCDDHAFKLLSATLGLSPSALSSISSYYPAVATPEGLIQIVSPFGHAGVNAYLIVQGQHALVFDTGTDASSLLAYLDQHQLILDTLFITHKHHDHLAEIKKFDKTRIIYPENTEHGQKTSLLSGDQLTTLDVSGHANPARAYYYEGLGTPVCIVGDSVFAGSMGKSPDKMRYKQAMKTARENLMSLPPATILCPGHGPMTTIALEQKHNAFLAETNITSES